MKRTNISFTRASLTHLLSLSLLLLAASSACAQTAAFTYQGRLTEVGNPATGTYDMQFKLFDSAAVGSGAQQGGTIANSAVQVANGVFTVTLDFGTGVFDGSPRFIEVGVRPGGNSNPYNLLAPRQPVTSTPYAIYSLVAKTAETATTATTVANGAAVKSLNTLKDNVTLAAGANVTITPSGNTLTIASSGGSGGGNSLWSLAGADAYYNAGKVGIGTMGPLTPLEVNGILRSTRSNVAPQYIQLNGGDSGSIKLTAQSTLAAEKNLFIQNLSGEATPGANNNIQFELGTTAAPSTKMTIAKDGNVGIGITSPQDRLHVFDPAGSVSQRIETGGGVNAWARTEYANANGQWNIGTSRGFNGDQLYFHRQGETVNAFAIQPNGDALLQGNLGIGTTTPGARLHAETGSAFTSAIYGNATGAGGVGVFGQSATANGTGVYGVSTAGAAVHAEGNATQARDKGGFVKAMAYIDGDDGTIFRCFNSSIAGSAASAGNCGFITTGLARGVYRINFGFRVSDRFIAITSHRGDGNAAPNNMGANFVFFDSTTVDVITFDVNDGEDSFNNSFMIIVF